MFPYFGHGDANACMLDLIAAFIARPEPSVLQVDCAEQITPPLFSGRGHNPLRVLAHPQPVCYRSPDNRTLVVSCGLLQPR